MQVSQTAEYALRAMAHLASRRQEEEGTRAVDLADEVNVPLAYLQKILRRLVVAGLLESRKGHGGGFRLVLPPNRISFGQVLEAADGAMDAGHCAFGWEDCDPNHPCPLHPAWSRLNECISAWAENTTLADVIGPKAQARRPAAARSRK